ncbi:KAP family NTPase [Jatrophihabitans cynanchi]|uniref:KAP family NTPase n=1 Tax=Jatrophihabitans cynanchi TaxID=2944128 RepID=A0ABY7JRE9_9ACTN|nr:P-loop NTPase fold protein [Jatrophihabitans sp. SB3-54]WAX55134.1 KAP family NTPase [Jatrophihabitans sp. SB3-54]
MDQSASAPMFDDNPTTLDLLGFGGVVDAVVRVLDANGLDPVTIGVQSGWGGGKSTLLRLVEERLKAHERLLVVTVDPWEFEESQDVRGTLIALVLNAVQERVEAEADGVSRDRIHDIVEKLQGLRRRIAWGRVAKVLITSAATQGLALPELIDALTPAPPSGKDEKGEEKPQSMAGFREDFAALMQSDLGITRVVVLVDDLDRCLPASAVATLEAIKLFLSVKKMAFVLAADEALVRASINSHLGGLAQGEFANRYTEKIVQIPLSLPRLSQRDAEAYVALLLAGQLSNMSGEQNKAMIERARIRRRAGEAPYAIDGAPGAPGPTAEHQRLAAVISRGLSADRWQTPRAVKRFLNNLAIREQIADEAGAHLPLDVLVKMYLLELRHLSEFKTLAALGSDERTDLLRRWEDWADGKEDAAKPAEVSDATQAWAQNEPRLVGRGSEIERYLSLAATLISDVTFGGAMDSQQRKMVEQLLAQSDTVRRAALQDVLAMTPESQDVIVRALGESLPVQDDARPAFLSLTALATESGRLAPEVETMLQRPALMQKVKAQWVPVFRKMPSVLKALAEAGGLDEAVTKAAQKSLEAIEKARNEG